MSCCWTPVAYPKERNLLTKMSAFSVFLPVTRPRSKAENSVCGHLQCAGEASPASGSRHSFTEQHCTKSRVLGLVEERWFWFCMLSLAPGSSLIADSDLEWCWWWSKRPVSYLPTWRPEFPAQPCDGWLRNKPWTSRWSFQLKKKNMAVSMKTEDLIF